MGEVGGRRRALDGGAHGISVVLDDEHDGQLPQLRHVEALVDLPLVGGAVAEVGQAHRAVAAIAVGEGDAGAQRHVGADDAVPSIEVPLLGEHMHRAALALGVAALPPRQLRHDALGVHAGAEHVAVVAIGCNDLVALLDRHLHAHHHGLLADVEVAEAADEAHAVELRRLLLEAADEQHPAVGAELLVACEGGDFLLAVGAGHVRRTPRGIGEKKPTRNPHRWPAARAVSGGARNPQAWPVLRRPRRRCGRRAGRSPEVGSPALR